MVTHEHMRTMRATGMGWITHHLDFVHKSGVSSNSKVTRCHRRLTDALHALRRQDLLNMPSFAAIEVLVRYMVQIEMAAGAGAATGVNAAVGGASMALNDLGGCAAPRISPSALQRIHQQVDAFGDPLALDGDEAPCAVVKSEDDYGGRPTPVRPHEPHLLKVFDSGVRALSIRSLVPDSTPPLINEPALHIFRSQAVLDRMIQGGELPPLIYIGLVGVWARCRGRAGIFFAGKKDGSLRVVVDGREPSATRRRPPRTELGSAAALSGLCLDSDRPGGRAARAWRARGLIARRQLRGLAPFIGRRGAGGYPAGVREARPLLPRVCCAAQDFVCCGVQFDFVAGRAAPQQGRGWRLRRATTALLDRRGRTPGAMGVLLGHVARRFMPLTPALSVLSSLVCSAGDCCWFDAEQLRELNLVKALIPLAGVDLRAPWHPWAYYSDASTRGNALAAFRFDTELRDIGARRERWRFRVADRCADDPGDPPGSEVATLAAYHVSRDADDVFAGKGRPRVVHGAFLFPAPIRVLEGQTTLLGLRRATRSAAAHGCRALSIGDNFSSMMSFETGRCANPVLRQLAHPSATRQIATGAQFYRRESENKRAPADYDSRAADRFELAPGQTQRGSARDLRSEPASLAGHLAAGPVAAGPAGAAALPAPPPPAPPGLAGLAAPAGAGPHRPGAQPPRRRQSRHALELYAHCARLAAACLHEGLLRWVPVDISRGAWRDLTGKDVIRVIRSLVVRREVRRVHLGAPRAPFSQVTAFLERNRHYFVNMHYCHYNCCHLKPTTLVTDLKPLEALSARCSRDHVHGVLTGKGRLDPGNASVWKTSLAGGARLAAAVGCDAPARTPDPVGPPAGHREWQPGQLDWGSSVAQSQAAARCRRLRLGRAARGSAAEQLAAQAAPRCHRSGASEKLTTAAQRGQLMVDYLQSIILAGGGIFAARTARHGFALEEKINLWDSGEFPQAWLTPMGFSKAAFGEQRGPCPWAAALLTTFASGSRGPAWRRPPTGTSGSELLSIKACDVNCLRHSVSTTPMPAPPPDCSPPATIKRWAARMLRDLERATPAIRPLFPFAAREFELAFGRAADSAGLQRLRLRPRSLRHGGASVDFALNCRSLAEVQRRGRWTCAASVRRCEMAGRLTRQPQHPVQLPRYGFASPTLVPQRPVQPVPPPGGGDATRKALLGDSPARPGGAVTSWALEERLKAEQARAQQVAWAESMRAQYLGIPAAAAPDRTATPVQTPEKATPQKSSPKKQEASTAFDRLLLLSKLGAAWDQHQAGKQAAGAGGGACRAPPPPGRSASTEEGTWWSAREDAFSTPTKKEPRQSARAGRARGRHSRSGRV
ncbi:unnamed protein product [Prorocentrum cordatum]|uniref:Uncharacterized protein n=1 Tax=Prorocentrum cordatum TaxID=2364126 RepID=A0ABN9U1D1_9DINO|nr:unnamed protein product [Polarella glacialis]